MDALVSTTRAAVRPARADDADAVRDLVRAAGLPTEGLEQAWGTLVADDGSREGEVAELAGVVALERHGTAGAPAFLLRSLAVRADRRGGGLGAALVTAGLAAADADRGAPATVGLLTETAEGYFDRFGFIPVDRTQLPSALAASPEVASPCPRSARAYLRTARRPGDRLPPAPHRGA